MYVQVFFVIRSSLHPVYFFASFGHYSHFKLNIMGFYTVMLNIRIEKTSPEHVCENEYAKA